MYRKSLLLASTLTPRKLANFTSLYTSFYTSQYQGKSLHRGNPVKLGLEPTTACNLRCPECPSGLRSFTRPTGTMKAELFETIIDQTYKDLIYLLLYFQGEPYLNPRFLPMVAYAHGKNIYTSASTNGHFLGDEKARETVESGLSELIVSVDGTSQETYEAYRVGGKLETVLQGVQNLIAWRKRLRRLHPHIILQFLVVRPNEHQIPEIKALGKRLGVDEVVLKTAQIYDFEQGHPLIPTIDRYSRYRKGPEGLYHIKNPLLNQCWKLWQGAEITWDGRVLPCCFDKDAQYQLGKIPEQSFQDIWRGQAYHDFRNGLLRSRKELDICRNCSEGMRVWE